MPPLPLLIAVLAITLLALIGVAWLALRSWASRARAHASLDRVYLHVLIPKKESRDDREKSTERDFRDAASVMEPLLASLHALSGEGWADRRLKLASIGLEYVVVDGQILFLVSCPAGLRSAVEKQLLAQYPDALVEQAPPPVPFPAKSITLGTTLSLKRDAYYPVRTYKTLETDPINGITNALSKLRSTEGALIQLLIRPAGEKWMEKAQSKAKALMNSEDKKGFLSMLWGGAGASDKPKEPKRLTPKEEEIVKLIQEKAGKVGFETVLRIVVAGGDEATAKADLREIATAFSQFTDPNCNRFVQKAAPSERLVALALRRVFTGAGKASILNTEELTSLFHLPHSRYNQAPSIRWQNFKIAPPPANLPKEGVLLGTNTFRGVTQEVRLSTEDRFRHMYIIGQTGTGKSSMLLNMAMQDVRAGHGIAIMDPHGDLARDLLKHIPKERAKDVIYFNAADTERPMGLNILEAKDRDEWDFVVNEALSIMLKLFGAEIFSPRLQDYFRNGCLTLLEDKDGGAITDLVRLFTDDAWQQQKVRSVKNPIVREWWDHMFASQGQREKQEMVPFWAAKFGQFITNSTMRNIIGQTRSAFDFGDVMDSGKILLVNVSKGELGEFNSSLIGMILVTKLTQAAFQRAKVEKSQRRDFFLYIDEFQNFVTDSIEMILSEARKYRMSLNVAHQYIGQLVTEKNEKIKNAIFGNVGSMLSYKIGATDAEYMAREFAPVFSDQDLINIDVYKAAVKLSISGQPSRPFSLKAANPFATPGDAKLADAIIQLSRLTHGRDRKYVDREILLRIGSAALQSSGGMGMRAPQGSTAPYG